MWIEPASVAFAWFFPGFQSLTVIYSRRSHMKKGAQRNFYPNYFQSCLCCGNIRRSPKILVMSFQAFRRALAQSKSRTVYKGVMFSESSFRRSHVSFLS